MKTESADTAQPSIETPPEILDADDLDFADEKLGPRQEDATRIFVCEGGCE